MAEIEDNWYVKEVKTARLIMPYVKERAMYSLHATRKL